jgi:hypothetical protein
MIGYLLGKLPKGEGMYLKVGREDGITFITVSSDVLGDLYTFSSTNYVEVVDKVSNYIDSLTDFNKYEKLLDEINGCFEEEVVNG